VVAALVAGQTVAARPVENKSVAAKRFVALLHEVGMRRSVMLWIRGRGETAVATPVSDVRAVGPIFTGGTQGARSINRALAEKAGAKVAPIQIAKRPLPPLLRLDRPKNSWYRRSVQLGPRLPRRAE
jgi:delta 1-pyrroline-5-carboxylate dehydrogenase